jgi:hypothetical protein
MVPDNYMCKFSVNLSPEWSARTKSNEKTIRIFLWFLIFQMDMMGVTISFVIVGIRAEIGDYQ